MNTMNRRPMQLTVLAVAFLAVVAVAAVMLLGGGGPAQADTASLAPDGGGGIDLRPVQQDEDPTPTPQTEPEDCLKPAAHVIFKKHYAVFDVFWDDDGLHAPVRERTLINNPCPPRAEHGSDESTTRYASDIDIGQTIFHVRTQAEQALAANSATDYAKYPFLYPNAKDTNGNDSIEDGETGGPLSTKIWVLRSCEHDLSPPPSDNELCVGFSAGLLQASQWDGNVQYHFESIREPGINPADRGEAYAFANLGDDDPFWATPDAGRNAFSITPGTYEHLYWVFTKPGTYVLGVHVQGAPAPSLGLPSGIHAVTSEIREYTFHVGKLADVGVALAAAPKDATDPSLDPGEEVTITVTASNAGPNEATKTHVRVDLPEGLSYVSHSTNVSNDTYDSDDRNPVSTNAGLDNVINGVEWNIGTLQTPTTQNTTDDGKPPTLTITARVKNGTQGYPLKVTALIEAFERIGTSSEVVELDPLESNNTARVTITPTAIPNVIPMFLVERTLPVESQIGTIVGAPILVKEANNVNDATTDTLTFSLSGQGAGEFTVNNVNGSAQIAINTPSLSSWHYHLKLHVSDGKDHFGNADPSIDHSIAVRITESGVN